MAAMNWQEFWTPVRLSLQVALFSSLVVIVLGVAAAWWMSRRSFRGKTALETVFMLPLVLPPTVVGFVLAGPAGPEKLDGATD
ncbi:hypothetical protein LJK87_35760 [Paenibacillus sp. P25]|nr:hypothetical protein LJK87_35760 [Paenibacillus sp. P25]